MAPALLVEFDMRGLSKLPTMNNALGVARQIARGTIDGQMVSDSVPVLIPHKPKAASVLPLGRRGRLVPRVSALSRKRVRGG